MKLNDLFYSLQGEGHNSGRAAFFFRFPFCNLDCPWCDTEFETYQEYSIEQILKFIESAHCRFAVITGGEPAMNKEVPELIFHLRSRGFEIAMESNGQFPVPDGVDWLTLSPKRWVSKSVGESRPPFWFDRYNQPSEIKFIFDKDTTEEEPLHIYDQWEKGEFFFKTQEPLFYLSPEWNAKEAVIPRMVKFIRNNPTWRMSLQTHKIIDVK